VDRHERGLVRERIASMPFMPFSNLGIWFRCLLAIAIIVGGIYLIKCWYDECQVVLPVRVVSNTGKPDRDGDVRVPTATSMVGGRRVFRLVPGMNRETSYFASAVPLLGWAMAGSLIRRAISTISGGSKPAPDTKDDEPFDNRDGEVLSYLNSSAHRSTHILARRMLGIMGYDATAALRTIPVPTLVVVGDQDTTTLLEAGQYISEHVPNARLATLSPAKHLGLIEHHAQFDELVAGFADSCPTTTGSSDGFARRRSMLR
jgi:pimeloyl-ACP methyl ester carboxylesterase